MTTTNRLYVILALLVLAGILVGGVYLWNHTGILGARPAPLPTPAQWADTLSTSTAHTLEGSITALKSGSLTLSVKLPPGVGTTSILVGSSTPVTKHTPKSAEEMAAAFKEFQRLQKEANGESFDAPDASNITNVSFGELKIGDSVIITLTHDSTKDRFVAQSIEVTPDAAPATGAQ
jgi:hypothetical protein